MGRVVGPVRLRTLAAADGLPKKRPLIQKESSPRRASDRLSHRAAGKEPARGLRVIHSRRDWMVHTVISTRFSAMRVKPSYFRVLVVHEPHQLLELADDLQTIGPVLRIPEKSTHPRDKLESLGQTSLTSRNLPSMGLTPTVSSVVSPSATKTSIASLVGSVCLLSSILRPLLHETLASREGRHHIRHRSK